ncbi:unnamed protein product [Durusdinium trenchii]|uniref:Serine protease n=1 Tax=Durusdinium trenchii TaxID=1381693 RepID=A0ABP0NJ04_9DINO
MASALCLRRILWVALLAAFGAWCRSWMLQGGYGYLDWFFPEPAVGAVGSVVLVRAMDAWRPWGRSHGSGFVWQDGHVVTNSHVVQLTSLLSVHFADGAACRASVVGTAERCDVALLELHTTSCSGGTSPFVLPKPLRLAPKPPKLGEEVMAVGHPGNWAWLVGKGAITGVGRDSSRAVQKWEALSEFQRFCAVNGMVFASVPAGRGSSGGPLINGRGEVVGITTWQFQSTPLLTAAVSASTLHQLLPELLQGSGGVSAPTIGVEEHLGPAKLIFPSFRNAQLGVSASGARLWWPGRPLPWSWRGQELWWLDEVKSIQGKPVESVADVYEVVQSAPVGAQLQLQLKRFGFFDVNASAVVRCRPPEQHQLLRRLLRATWRALSTAQVALAIHEFTRNVRKDLTKVRSAVEEMEKCGFFNVSHKDDNMKQLSLATARFLVKGDAFKNLCLPPRSHAQCVVPTNAKKKTWKRVPLFDLCRLNCNAQIIDAPTFCCMHVAQTKTCQLISGGNATTTSRLMGSVATICKPMPVLQLLRALKLLWALALSVLRD